MKNFCLLLIAACLFSITTFAHDTIHVTGKTDNRMLDAIGPVITYTAITKSSCLTTKSFTATITDVDGVNTTVGTRPRFYYKRSTDANTWNGNTSATAGWKYAEATNTTSPFNFNIDYSLLSGGTGITVGQTIEYFVVAQDLVATPNISINNGSFALAPASVNLTAAAFPVSGTNSHTVVNALATYITVGAFGDFGNFTPAGSLFNIINNVGLSGNTTIEIIDPLITENNSQPLNQIQNTGCSAGTVTLLIKPAAGVTATITGNVSNNPIMRVLSSNVTIDGSNNGTTSRNLTLQNTNTTSPVVILYGSTGTVPINNSTLKNTICNNGANTTSSVVVSDAAVGGAPGYFNNITIQNNSIQKGLIGLQCAAAPSSGNGSMLITGNDLNSTLTNQIGAVGIYTDGLDGATISNNSIGNFESAVTSPRYGIWMVTNTINTTISGNTISGINYTGSGSALTHGIYLGPGVAASNNNVTGNTISNITSTGTNTVYGIHVAGASGGITIQKNNISNIKNNNASANGYSAWGISLISSLTAANITVANNFISDVAGYGSGTTPTVRNGFGIYLGGGGGYKIYHNSVNMNTDQTNTNGISAALMITGVTTASSLDIRNNILSNLQFSGVPAASRYSIYSLQPNTIFANIDNNDYFTAGTNLGFLGINRTTLADIVTGFGGNANSINATPDFVSFTDLHLKPSSLNCPINNKGTFIAAVTDDIDAQTRSTSTPDPGADEFTAMGTTLAGIAGSPVCDNKAVTVGGTLYTSGCNLIATVVPSGLDPVSGTINTCVTLDAIQQYFNGEPYVQRHYDIEPAISNQTTTSATITLYFTDDEFVDYNTNNPVWPPLPTATLGNADPNRVNLKITQFHGVASTSPSTPGNYPGTRVLIDPVDTNIFWNGSYWEVSFNVTGFSGFYVHSNFTNTPLPVAVNYLTGRKQGSDHLLNWKVTCTGSTGVTMTLERSADARNFTGIHTIAATALRCQQPFDHTDTDPLKGMNYYRIKIIDSDGKITYSTTVALLNAVKGFDIISIAPNPVVNGNFKLNVTSAQAGKMDVAIFDMQGRLVNAQTITVSAGFNSLPVHVNDLSPGTYTIRGNMAGEPSRVLRFVKQ